MSTQLGQIAKKAKLDRKVRFTSLAHLLTPLREWLAPKIADLYGKDFFELNPFPTVSWVNLAFWLAVPALVWKFLWDVVLQGWREKLQWRNLPRRIELWAMAAWVLFIIIIGGKDSPDPQFEIKRNLVARRHARRERDVRPHAADEHDWAPKPRW
jgi:hypothetical protein